MCYHLCCIAVEAGHRSCGALYTAHSGVRATHTKWLNVFSNSTTGVIGPPWPTKYVGEHIIGGIRPEQFDVFMELILIDELSRCGSGGVMWGLAEGLTIGLPPVLLFGSEYLRDKVAKPCLTGDKIICLCVTEPNVCHTVASNVENHTG